MFSDRCNMQRGAYSQASADTYTVCATPSTKYETSIYGPLRAVEKFLKQEYRRAGMLIINPRNEILLVQGKMSKLWGIPKGAPNHYMEHPWRCAKREVSEETGVVIPNHYRKDSPRVFYSDRKFIIYVIQLDQLADIGELQINDVNEIQNIGWFPIWFLPKKTRRVTYLQDLVRKIFMKKSM